MAVSSISDKIEIVSFYAYPKDVDEKFKANTGHLDNSWTVKLFSVIKDGNNLLYTFVLSS